MATNRENPSATMLTSVLHCIVIIFVFAASSVHGQVQSKGRHAAGSFDQLIHQVHQSVIPLFGNPNSVNRLLAKTLVSESISDPIRLTQKRAGEYLMHSVSIYDHRHIHLWKTSPIDQSTRVWRMAIKSPDAQGIGLYFSKMRLAPEAELYIIGQNNTIGAFTAAINNKIDGTFSTWPVSGDTIIIELWEPIDSKSVLELEGIIHDHGTKHFGLDTSGSCNINVHPMSRLSQNHHRQQQQEEEKTTIEAVESSLELKEKETHPSLQVLETASRSVVQLRSGRGLQYCSGVMINNASGLKRQLLLTAAHCVPMIPNRTNGKHAEISDILVSFLFEKQDEQGRFVQHAHTASGLKYLAYDKSRDFALMEVVEPLPPHYRVHLAGWSAATNPRPNNVFCIHHPLGDAKKFSQMLGSVMDGKEHPSAGRRLNGHWVVPEWTLGTTERGSSGSPLFDFKGRVLGHLNGGFCSCSFKRGFDYFTRIDAMLSDGFFDRSNPVATSIKDLIYPDRRRHVLAIDGQDI